MTWWELFTALASAASIISLAIALSSIYNGRATRSLIREIRAETGKQHSDTLAVLERMDQRADERHREVIQAIQALRG